MGDGCGGALVFGTPTGVLVSLAGELDTHWLHKICVVGASMQLSLVALTLVPAEVRTCANIHACATLGSYIGACTVIESLLLHIDSNQGY